MRYFEESHNQHTITMSFAELVVLSAAVNHFFNSLTEPMSEIRTEDEVEVYVQSLAEEAGITADEVMGIADEFICTIPGDFEGGKVNGL